MPGNSNNANDFDCTKITGVVHIMLVYMYMEGVGATNNSSEDAQPLFIIIEQKYCSPNIRLFESML